MRKIKMFVFEIAGQSAVMMTFDLNSMGYTFQMKGNFMNYK